MTIPAYHRMPLDSASRALDLARRDDRRGFDVRFARALAMVVGRPALALPVAVALVFAIGTADYLTSFEARLAILYVIPVALATWSRARSGGAVIALLSVFTWATSYESKHGYSHDAYFYWDCVVMGATLLLFVELLTRLRIALARSDERLLRVLNGLHAAVVVTDGEEVLFANARMAALIGNDRVPTLEEVAARFPLAAVRTPRDPAGELDLVESDLRDPVDGRVYVTHAGAITWIDGRRVRLSVMTDVTEQRRAEALQREHQAALHHTARLVNLAEAATTLAHELNQPLGAIVSYNDACLRLLESDRATPAELASAMEKCRVQAVRAGDILKRLRELARRRTPRLSESDFNAMLREVLTWVQDDLDRAGVTVHVALAPGLPQVRADRILVEQVMLNLVNNAVDAMQGVAPLRRRLTIETCVQEDGAVQVSVADEGTGIVPDVEPRLYTPFFTTKERGLGLGLAICRSVVEMHGGRLWHEARPAGGTTFNFSIPRENT